VRRRKQDRPGDLEQSGTGFRRSRTVLDLGVDGSCWISAIVYCLGEGYWRIGDVPSPRESFTHHDETRTRNEENSFASQNSNTGSDVFMTCLNARNGTQNCPPSIRHSENSPCDRLTRLAAILPIQPSVDQADALMSLRRWRNRGHLVSPCEGRFRRESRHRKNCRADRDPPRSRKARFDDRPSQSVVEVDR
jgi:hypothetical protein